MKDGIQFSEVADLRLWIVKLGAGQHLQTAMSRNLYSTIRCGTSRTIRCTSIIRRHIGSQQIKIKPMTKHSTKEGEQGRMRVLVACEESQAVCMAFRERGHEAYSCDLLPCSGGHPEWHIRADVRTLLNDYFDLVIFHPPCTILSNSGVRWLHEIDGRWDELAMAIEFFNLRHKFNSPKVATENPVPHKYAVRGRYLDGSGIGKEDQAFQPWHFGHRKMKETRLWLKGLPLLQWTNVVGPPPKNKAERRKWADCWMASPGPDRARIRSITYPGVAAAMASQWSPNLNF